MLNAIVRFSIRFRGVIIALALLLSVYGIFVASRSRLDIFPEFAPPQVIIHTNAPGLSPEEVEKLVTRPIENAINGVAGLETLRSISVQGFSVVTGIFHEGTPILPARQLVSERLTEIARSLPQVAQAPVLAPLTSATSLVLMAGLTSPRRTAAELRTFADYELTPRLLSVPGVAKVVVYGGEVRQLQIQLIPERLEKYGISFEDVVAGASNATGVKAGGFIETDSQRLTLKTIGQALSANGLAEVVVRRAQGISVKLKDLANVVEGFEPKLGDSQIMGQPGVVIMVSDQYGANTLEVTQGLDRALSEMGPLFQAQDIKLDANVFRPARFIETALSNIRSSLLLGGLLVVIILFLFLWNPRISFISLSAIPLSLLLAIIVLDLLGISLNTLTLGGLAIAIGEVVDDAIIDVENIFRRLKENAKSRNPLSKLRVVLQASLEVRHSVIYATFVVILVFLPVVSLSGVQGRLFAPLGWAYIFSILASLLLALTLTPALSGVFLNESALRHTEPRGVQAIKHYYRSVLSNIVRRPRRLIITSIISILAAIAALPFFGGTFLPDFQEGHLIVHMNLIPGTSLKESLRMGKQVTEALVKLPEVRSVAQTVGSAENADDVLGTFESELHIDLKLTSGEDTDVIQGKIRQVVSDFPGANFSLNTFLTERIEETVAGSTAQVVVTLFGNDLTVLDQKSNDIVALLSHIPGAIDVRREAQPTVPEITMTLKPWELGKSGIPPGLILDAIQTAYQGTPVAQVYQGNRVIGVSAILEESTRRDPEQIGNLPVRNADGKWFELRDLADIRSGSGRYSILHENTLRRQVVTCNVTGRDVASFTDEVKRRITKEIQMPKGVYTTVTGAALARAQAQSEILLRSLLAAGVILLLLWMAFRTGRNLLLVLSNLPFALVGGVLAVFGTGGWLSLGSLVGFVTLFGITTRNSIMLISHYQHLVEYEGAVWDIDTAIRGATERLLPILMTASVTALGLLPLAIGTGTPGREIEGPMAIVILGGLVSSTALNLLVLPTLSLRFGKFTPRATDEDLLL